MVDSVLKRSRTLINYKTSRKKRIYFYHIEFPSFKTSHTHSTVRPRRLADLYRNLLNVQDVLTHFIYLDKATILPIKFLYIMGQDFLDIQYYIRWAKTSWTYSTVRPRSLAPFHIETY